MRIKIPAVVTLCLFAAATALAQEEIEGAGTANCVSVFTGTHRIGNSRIFQSPSGNIGIVSTLRIKWDQPNHNFIFQLNNQAEVVSHYAVSDTTPAVFSYKTINAGRVVPHCRTTRRPFISMDAFVSNVYVNP